MKTFVAEQQNRKTRSHQLFKISFDGFQEKKSKQQKAIFKAYLIEPLAIPRLTISFHILKKF